LLPGLDISSVAVGDFRGSGQQDVVVNGNSVLLGNGDGSFQEPLHLDTGLSVFTADLTGNGRSDVVAVSLAGPYNAQNGTVSALLSNGDGSFHSAGTMDVGDRVVGVAVGDFRGDGHQDLVVANLKGEVVVLLGNGDGSFNNAPIEHVDFNLDIVAAGDFTGSGRQDIVTVGSSGVAVLLNNGDGTFRSGPTLADRGFLTSVVVGDFTGSGRQDIAVADSDESHGLVKVYLGNGDGTFQAPQTFDLGFNVDAQQIVAGDFNGDGLGDLAVTYRQGSSHEFVKVLLSNGDGSFQDAQTFEVPDGSFSLAAGHFHDPGIVDLVTASADGGGVSVLLGNGDGSFRNPINIPLGGDLRSVAVGDFAGTGTDSLAVASFRTSAVLVLLGNGNGTFQQPVSYPVGNFPDAVAVGDFSGNGRADLAVLNIGGDTLRVLANNGDGTFQGAVSYLVGGADGIPGALTVGNFGGAGLADVAVAQSDGITVVLNQGAGPAPAPSAPPARVAQLPPALDAAAVFAGVRSEAASSLLPGRQPALAALDAALAAALPEAFLLPAQPAAADTVSVPLYPVDLLQAADTWESSIGTF
jgi:hypothetical protein